MLACLLTYAYYTTFIIKNQMKSKKLSIRRHRLGFTDSRRDSEIFLLLMMWPGIISSVDAGNFETYEIATTD